MSFLDLFYVKKKKKIIVGTQNTYVNAVSMTKIMKKKKQ